MRIIHRNRCQTVATTKMIDALRRGTLSRRQMFRLLGGAGLAGAGVLGQRRFAAFAQDATAPPMAATPSVGPQADGSTLWRVKVGEMNMEEQIEFHAFFPGEITINAGDAIWFDFGMGGFHTVSFLAGGDLPPLFMPDPEVDSAAATPAASGPPKLVLNPEVVFPQGGDRLDGTSYVNSGIDVFGDLAVPYVVTFTAPGTYDYLCVPHASVMRATIVVQETGATLPRTQADYDQLVADDIAQRYGPAQAEKARYAEATSTQNADGTTAWEATVGAGGDSQTRIQAILPAEMEIAVGDTVKWVNRSPGEPHTVSLLGAGEEPPEDLLVEQYADGMPKFVQSMLTFMPQGGDVWSGSGWLNSGFLGIPQLGLPMEVDYTFDTPGDYIVFCVLHGDAQGGRMAAKLKVSPK